VSNDSLEKLSTGERTPPLDGVSGGRSGFVVSSSHKASVFTSEQVNKRELSRFAFVNHGNNAWLYNGIHDLESTALHLCETIEARDREIERLRTALKQIDDNEHPDWCDESRDSCAQCGEEFDAHPVGLESGEVCGEFKLRACTCGIKAALSATEQPKESNS